MFSSTPVRTSALKHPAKFTSAKLPSSNTSLAPRWPHREMKWMLILYLFFCLLFSCLPYFHFSWLGFYSLQTTIDGSEIVRFKLTVTVYRLFVTSQRALIPWMESIAFSARLELSVFAGVCKQRSKYAVFREICCAFLDNSCWDDAPLESKIGKKKKIKSVMLLMHHNLTVYSLQTNQLKTNKHHKTVTCFASSLKI